MPVHPSEEEAPSGIFEKIAKDPSSASESTASDHEHHENEHTPGKASAEDHQSKGPAIPMNMSGMSPTRHCERIRWLIAHDIPDMPPKASKEELKARSEELNP
ncbi:hypothetical protein HO133_004010 [Letharia lupina]|uniref:Uncharacterized protein n=1 Tax=Letharia lupina TaxID=560253 RepID=A0A8H6CAA4_9LECA|nr:uncharacterized protein HO133_004010 [Letharia lupina]KAF6219541.1 hypothetical protein HO133_004010 [Letharia lupina]